MRRLLCAFFGAIVACVAAIAPVRAEKDVILARTSPDVVLVWKVNDALGTLATKHLPSPELQRALLIQSVDVMSRALPAEATATEMVTAKLVYFNNGGYDPNYKIETVSGVRRVGEISVPAGRLRRDAAKWKAQLARGHVPGELHVQFADDAFTGLGP